MAFLKALGEAGAVAHAHAPAQAQAAAIVDVDRTTPYRWRSTLSCNRRASFAGRAKSACIAGTQKSSNIV